MFYNFFNVARNRQARCLKIGAGKMTLIQSYFVDDSLFANVGYSHGIDPQTRLRLRIGRMTDIVQRTYEPVLALDPLSEHLMWYFPVERCFGVKWEVVSQAIQKASKDFFATCAVH